VRSIRCSLLGGQAAEAPLSFIEQNPEWLLLIVGTAAWLILITSTAVSLRTKIGELRTDVNKLARAVQHLTIAEDRRFMETINGCADAPLIPMPEEEDRQIRPTRNSELQGDHQ
jgi:hypothetical protein